MAKIITKTGTFRIGDDAAAIMTAIDLSAHQQRSAVEIESCDGQICVFKYFNGNLSSYTQRAANMRVRNLPRLPEFIQPPARQLYVC